MNTIDKIPATLEGVQAYARKHGLRLGFDGEGNAARAMRQIDTSLGGMYEAMHLVDTLYKFPAVRATGAGNKSLRALAIVARDGWSDDAYATTLHEFGHLLSSNQSAVNDDNPADEIDAWAWARAHASHWTGEMQAAMAFALGSYGVTQLPPQLT